MRSFNLYENVGGQAERKTSSYGALGHETLGVCLRSINGEERRANIDKHQLGWIATYAVNQDYYNENGAQCYDFVRSCMTDEPRVAEKSDKQLRRLKDATIFWKNIFSSSDNPTIEVGDVAGLKGNILSNNPNAMGHVMIIAGEINGRAACISKLGTYEMPCIHSTDTAFHYYGGIPVVLNKKKLV